MNGLRCRKKLKNSQPFTVTSAIHTSSLIFFTHVKLQSLPQVVETPFPFPLVQC